MLMKLVPIFMISCCYAYNIETDWIYVLRNPDFAQPEREAYFGYTVCLFASGSSSWALVGAPRANDTQVTGSDVKERGALYLCPLPVSSAPCRQLTVTTADNGSKGGAGNKEYFTLQDYGWLGGSLDMRPEDPDSVIVTCSPRWMNQMHSYDDYYVNGACYLTSMKNVISSGSSEKQWNIVTPLVDIELQRIKDDNGILVYYYQLGQAGISAHVTEDGEQVWLGAPGMQQWTGSMVQMKKVYPGAEDWKYTTSETFKPAPQSLWSDYFGYSVESGRFFGSETHKVAGSPRYDLVGKVSVFTTTNDNEIQVRWEATGPQIGAYFGSSVATGDVNADGWSELFVGAPLFSVKGTAMESGLVVIYSLKANWDNLEESGRLFGSGQERARFGSALMVVGDLDRDGYKDLAVGAPYETGGAGAVYIYRGSADGLLMTVSQKLMAKDVSPILRGLGISISRGVDIDKNGYSDFAVGAHEGRGSAVVFRTRPVLKIHLVISSEYKILTETGMTFDVLSCVSYNGYNVLDETDVILNGQIDDGTTLPRAMFVSSGTALTTFKATMTRGHDSCFTFPIKVQHKIENYKQPLEVSFTAEVTYDDPECEKCGLTSPGSNYRSRVSIPLAFGCGPDAVCKPELELSVGWRNAFQLAIRSDSTVTLYIVVSVTGKEQSYLGLVQLLLPEGLTAHQPLPYSCSQSGREVSCSLPNPMVVGEKKELEISVMESGNLLEEGELPLKVICSASGTQDVQKELVLSVYEDVHLELSGHAEEDIIEYSPPPTPLVITRLTYQIINRGDTHVNEVRLDIYTPTTFGKLIFAQITQQKPTPGSSTSECSLQDASNGVAPLNVISNPSHKVSVKLVCGEQPLLSCQKVICRVRQIHISPLITVQMAYNITRLTENFGSNATVAIYTSAAAAYGNPTPSVYKESGIWTTLIPKDWLPSAQETPTWAFVVAVLVGLLILAAVIVLFVKIGFFKRKRPELNTNGCEEDLEEIDVREEEIVALQDTD